MGRRIHGRINHVRIARNEFKNKAKYANRCAGWIIKRSRDESTDRPTKQPDRPTDRPIDSHGQIERYYTLEGVWVSCWNKLLKIQSFEKMLKKDAKEKHTVNRNRCKNYVVVCEIVLSRMCYLQSATSTKTPHHIYLRPLHVNSPVDFIGIWMVVCSFRLTRKKRSRDWITSHQM